jgi:hypothetical protein
LDINFELTYSFQNLYKSFGIVPKWGLKRYVSDNLSFEFALGVGYSFNAELDDDFVMALDLKFCLNL